jgi:bacillithiol biosynthesis cysteine-adding enzyme BshC
MKVDCSNISYSDTGLFSNLVRDYVASNGTARSFVQYEPTYKGIENAIEQRKKYPTNRKVLVEVLNKQYQSLQNTQAVKANLDTLLEENTFVITTAHQPNIFTGPLYFFYKIIHTIQLAADLKKRYPNYNFVPVYYMGSEDADIEEVGSFVLDGAKHQWETKQTGAIGRMKVDDALLALLQNYIGYWSVKPSGKEVLAIIESAYQKGNTIAEATLQMVHGFFGQYGLVVLQPDDASLKSLFVEVMKKELLEKFSNAALQNALKELATQYHIQTEGRAINLFYLKDQIRARIEWKESKYIIVDTEISFTQNEILKELQDYPERFSPNVILRGLYQETILPGIVFVGGGGELAYWMELKNVFEQAHVHYPVLQLRNSFACIKEKQIQQWTMLGFNFVDLFSASLDLEVQYVKKHAGDQLSLQQQLMAHHELYLEIEKRVVQIDTTLGDHTKNLAHQSEKKLIELEKKMIRSERRKQASSIERIHHIKQSLFPENSLQERVENIAEWIGEYGWEWVEAVMQHSNSLDQNFTILTIK